MNVADLTAAADRWETLDREASESPWEVIESHGYDYSGEGYSFTTLTMRDTDGDVAKWYGETDREAADARLIATLRPIPKWAATHLRRAAAAWTTQVVDHSGNGSDLWHLDCELRVASDGVLLEDRPNRVRCQCFDDAFELAAILLGGGS